jgi:putative nucleotidyltransferase with HDIG domain
MNNIETIKIKMVEYFGSDQKRIDHTLAVAAYAKKILKEESADQDIVMTAAYLHDIGILEAERKYNSAAGTYQEKEGPIIAEKILQNFGFNHIFIEEVCDIIGHHHTPGIIESNNYQLLYEADWLVNLGADFKDVPQKKKKNIIDNHFKTKTGKKLAAELYLK